MARNLTWCFMRNFLKQKNHIFMPASSLQIIKQFEHTVQSSVSLTKEDPPNKDYQELKTYQEFLDDNCAGHIIAVRTLVNLLDVRRETAANATRKWPIINTLSKARLLKNYEFLRAGGAFRTTLRQNVYALADYPDDIQKKISCLLDMNLEINHGIALFQMPLKDLSSLAANTPTDRLEVPSYANRIEYLADKFEVHTSAICAVACHYPPILIMRMSKIVEITTFLLGEAGMERNNVLNDINIYRYKLETIKNRVERAKRAGISPMKPWIIRCPISSIEKLEQKKIQWDTLVGPNVTLEEHIRKLLNCDMGDIERLLVRDPDIKSVCIVKLTSQLQYLASIGYKVHDIYRTTRILHRAEKSIRDKYQRWMDAGLDHPPLSFIALPEKDFQEKRREHIAANSLNTVP